MNAELVFLRDRHQSIEVLREQARSLESKLAHTEGLRQKVAELEAELVQTSSTLSSLPPSTPSISDTQALSSLRVEHASLLDTHGLTLASLRSLQHAHTSLESQLASATSLSESLEQRFKAEKDARDKDNARIKLVEREVTFLKELVASYQAEEAIREEGEAKPDDTRMRRVSELESLIEEYKSTLASLLSSPLSTSPSEPPSPSPELLQQLDHLKSENTTHLERIDQLEQELFDLSGEIAGGRHIPPKTRILQLSDNPESRWFDLRQQTMDQLKAENDALLRRLKDLSPANANDLSPINPNNLPPANPSDTLIPPESYTSLQSTLSSLKSQLSQKEKRLLRLTQVFHSKATEFREAIAAILGVKLAFYPNGQVRVTSVFDLNASFVFQPAATGPSMKMQLVAQGEGGPQDLPSLMRYWIENEQCPPGFVASVTLECYDKAKREALESGEVIE